MGTGQDGTGRKSFISRELREYTGNIPVSSREKFPLNFPLKHMDENGNITNMCPDSRHDVENPFQNTITPPWKGINPLLGKRRGVCDIISEVLGSDLPSNE